VAPTTLTGDGYTLANYPIGGMGYDLCLHPIVANDDDVMVRCTLDEYHYGPHAWHKNGDLAIVWSDGSERPFVQDEHDGQTQLLDEDMLDEHTAHCPWCREMWSEMKAENL
jgi:hypothetical protein